MNEQRNAVVWRTLKLELLYEQIGWKEEDKTRYGTIMEDVVNFYYN